MERFVVFVSRPLTAENLVGTLHFSLSAAVPYIHIHVLKWIECTHLHAIVVLLAQMNGENELCPTSHTSRFSTLRSQYYWRPGPSYLTCGLCPDASSWLLDGLSMWLVEQCHRAWFNAITVFLLTSRYYFTPIAVLCCKLEKPTTIQKFTIMVRFLRPPLLTCKSW